MDSFIKTEELSFRYDSNETNKSGLVLDNINITVNKGEFLAVLGHNGSGKSTLAKHFNAILLPTGGRVYVKGIDTLTAMEEDLWQTRQAVGMVFQNPDNQLVATIVEEDIAFAPENLGIPPEEIRERVDKSLKIVRMDEYREHSLHQLSGGQKQRVAIAGILAMNPECIVLDEPTAMLDPRGRAEVLKTITLLNKNHSVTVVLITHYMDEAVEADRVVVLDKGRVLLDGSPRQVFAKSEILKKIGLELPQSSELINMLRQEGLRIDADVLTPDECVEALAGLLEGKNCR